MKFKRIFEVALLSLLATSCSNNNGNNSNGNDNNNSNPCEGVSCSGHGSCTVEGAVAYCKCESGYHTSGFDCVEDVEDLCEVPEQGAIEESLRLYSWGVSNCSMFGSLGEAVMNVMADYSPSLHLGTVRHQITWSSVGGGASGFDWTEHDEAILSFQDMGIQVLVALLCDTNDCARSENGVLNGPPTDVGAWHAFVTAVVRRYGLTGTGDTLPGLTIPVKVYQYGNEIVGHPQFWDPPAPADPITAYVEAQNDTYATIKAADPDAVVLLGSISGGTSIKAAIVEGVVCDQFDSSSPDGTCEAIATDPDNIALSTDQARILSEAQYDAVDIHFYQKYQWTPYRIAWLRQYTDVPIIATESGGPSRREQAEYDPTAHAKDMLKRLALMFGGGVMRVFNWNMVKMYLEDDPSHGCGSYGNSLTAFFGVDETYDPPQLGDETPGAYAWAMLSGLLPRVQWGTCDTQISFGDDLTDPSTPLTDQCTLCTDECRVVIAWSDAGLEQRQIQVENAADITVLHPVLDGLSLSFEPEIYQPEGGTITLQVDSMPVVVLDGNCQ